MDFTPSSTGFLIDGGMNAEVITAIRAAFDPNQPANVKEMAVTYCERLKQSPDGWRVCLPGLSQPQAEEVKFWCLEVLHHTAQHQYHLLAEADRALLRRSLMLYVKDVIPVTTQPAFVKNKLSLVLVKIVKVDYPERWGNFFTDFLALVNNGQNEQIVDVFLRVLKMIDDEIVCFEEGRSREEIQRCMAIKDSLRTDCMREIVDCMYRILHNSAILSQFLARTCLDTLSEYIGWIDLDLVGNQRFVTLFYSLLQNANLRSSAAQCLTQMVYKRMPPDKKVALLRHLDIIAVLLRFPLPQGDPDFLVAMATLASTLGQQVLSCTRVGNRLANRVTVEEVDATVSQQAMLMLDQALHLGYQFLGHDLMLVNDEMTEFYLTYTNMVKADEHLPGGMSHFRLILACIAKTLQYPAWYNFDRPGDRESKFDDFRTGGPGRIFINQVRCLPELCIDFLKEHATSVFAGKPTFQTVEAVLLLLYLSGEGLKSLDRQLKEDLPFRELACRLFAACSAEPHPQVQMGFFRCVVRFSSIFQHEPNMMLPVLTCFLDARGIRSPNETVRGTACYTVLKLVKQLPPELKRNLKPVLDPLLKALSDFVLPFFLCASLPSHRAIEDCQYICELMGILVSSAVVGTQDRQFCAKALSFFQQQLQQKLVERVDESQAQLFGTKVSHLINAMGCLSKSLSHDAKVVAPLFGESLTTVLSVYVLQPKHEDVRKMTIFFLHRMADCLAEEVIVFLPASLDILLRHSEPNNITPLLTLVNQLIVKFKGKMLSTLDVLIMPLVNKTIQCIDSYAFVDKAVTPAEINAVGPDSQERLSLFKLYYSLLKGVISCGCLPVVTSSRNIALDGLVLRSVLVGYASPESGVQKSCFYTLNELVTYIQSQNAIDKEVVKFMLEEATPKSMLSLFLPHLDLAKDAGTLMLHVEIVRFHLSMCKVIPQFLDCVGSYLVSSGLPPALAREYCGALAREDQTACKMLLKQIVEMKVAR